MFVSAYQNIKNFYHVNEISGLKLNVSPYLGNLYSEGNLCKGMMGLIFGGRGEIFGTLQYSCWIE